MRRADFGVVSESKAPVFQTEVDGGTETQGGARRTRLPWDSLALGTGFHASGLRPSKLERPGRPNVPVVISIGFPAKDFAFGEDADHAGVVGGEVGLGEAEGDSLFGAGGGELGS